MSTETIKTEDAVGFKIEKADGTVVEGAPKQPELETVDIEAKLKLHLPIKNFLDAQARKMNIPIEEIYSSLIFDGFYMHYYKMCRYCGEGKLKWLQERKNEENLAKKLKELKHRRMKKAQRQARKFNRG